MSAALCRRCDGSGEVAVRDRWGAPVRESFGQYVLTSCPVCGGSGRAS